MNISKGFTHTPGKAGKSGEKWGKADGEMLGIAVRVDVKSAVSVYQLDCPSNTLLWLARKMEKQNFAKPELQKQ